MTTENFVIVMLVLGLIGCLVFILINTRKLRDFRVRNLIELLNTQFEPLTLQEIAQALARRGDKISIASTYRLVRHADKQGWIMWCRGGVYILCDRGREYAKTKGWLVPV